MGLDTCWAADDRIGERLRRTMRPEHLELLVRLAEKWEKDNQLRPAPYFSAREAPKIRRLRCGT
jgi:hypothetical protein